ncbi:MAG: hypothetical protein AAF702_32625 [Chloroflexota bacterium]
MEISRQGVKPQRVHLSAFLLFLGLAVLFYSPLLLGLRTYPDGDFTHHFLPFSLFQQGELFTGRLPLWNPYTYSGHPFLADTQAAIFYPLGLLVMVLSYPLEGFFSTPAGARLYFLQVEAVIHIALAGFFTYLLVSTLTQQRRAALMAGILFAFSGYLTGYPPLQLAVLRSAIWLPLILFFLYRAFHSHHSQSWWLGFIFASTSAFLAGHPQTILHIGYTVIGWILFLLIWSRHHTPRLLFSLVLSTLAVVGLSAVQLLPSLEYTRLSVRAATNYDFVSAGFPLRDSWQLILPGVFTWFSPLYVGVVGLGLAFIAIGLFGRKAMVQDESSHESDGTAEDKNAPVNPLQPRPNIEEEVEEDAFNQPSNQLTAHPTWWHHQRFVIFFLLLAVISLLISYGRNGFLYSFFYRFAPGWDLFRQQERAAYLVSFGLSVLAGLGFAALTQMPLSRRRLLALLNAALVIGAVYSFGLLWQLPGHTVVSNWGYIGIAMITLLIVVIMAMLLWWEGWEPRRSWILMGLALLNLFVINISTNLTEFGPVRKTLLAPEMEALQAAVLERAEANLGIAGRVYNEYRVYDDYGMRTGIEDVWGSSPLKLDAYATLFDEFPLDRMWRLSGVEHVLTWRQELFEPSTLLASFPQAEDTTYLHRLNEPNPRAWLVSNIHYVSEADPAVAGILADHGFALEQVALVVDPNATAPQIGMGSGIGLATDLRQPEAIIQLQQTRPGHLSVTMQSENGGYLVISENFMPGWQVTNRICNGTAIACTDLTSPKKFPPFFQVNRTNLALVGLTVPAGQVSLELVYTPLSLRVGLWVSGLTLLLLLAAFLYTLFDTHIRQPARGVPPKPVNLDLTIH